MDSQQLMQSRTVKLVAAGAAALATSTATAIAVVLFLTRRRRRAAAVLQQTDSAPAQPAVATSMPLQQPDHFSENLLVPGITHTGSEVAEQDNILGRSPEGV